MSNRLTLEQLREAVTSDATRRADAQEQTIKELLERLRVANAYATKTSEQCWKLSRGRKCSRCDLIDSCAAYYSNKVLKEAHDDPETT